MSSTNPILSGKTALVTGGSRSLGRDIALRLADAGASVMVTYKQSRAGAEAVAEELRKRVSRAAVLQADFSTTADIPRLTAEAQSVLDEWSESGLDILVNNAGISSHGMIGDLTEEQVDEVYRVNYKSVLFLTQALLPKFRNPGRIVNIGSGLGRFALPGVGVYGSLKAALEHLTRYFARELGPRGITANAVSPGALDTDFNRARFEQNPQMVDFISSATALGRVGHAEDVGGVVALLCSDDAHWITGQRIEVSGGMFL